MKKKIKLFVASTFAAVMICFGAGVLAPSTAVFADNPMQEGLDQTQSVAGDNKNLFGDNGVFTKVIKTILYVLGAVSVLMLVYGGIRYTISGGDSAAVTAAKNTILYAIIGIVVALLAFAIVQFVVNQLS